MAEQEQVPQAWVDAAMDAASGEHLTEGEEFHGEDLDFGAAVAAVVPLIRKEVLGEVEPKTTRTGHEVGAIYEARSLGGGAYAVLGEDGTGAVEVEQVVKGDGGKHYIVGSRWTHRTALDHCSRKIGYLRPSSDTEGVCDLFSHCNTCGYEDDPRASSCGACGGQMQRLTRLEDQPSTLDHDREGEEDDLRNRAVANVDARHGFTAEHAPSPAQHRIEYDEEEERLAPQVDEAESSEPRDEAEAQRMHERAGHSASKSFRRCPDEACQVNAAAFQPNTGETPEASEKAKRNAEKALLAHMRALAPHELPCDCPARGIADLSQHAEECPRGVVHGFLSLFEALTAPLAAAPKPDCNPDSSSEPKEDR